MCFFQSLTLSKTGTPIPCTVDCDDIIPLINHATPPFVMCTPPPCFLEPSWTHKTPMSKFDRELRLTIVGLTRPEPCLVHNGLTLLVDYTQPAYCAWLLRSSHVLSQQTLTKQFSFFYRGRWRVLSVHIVKKWSTTCPPLVGSQTGVSWPSGLAYRTQVLVLATECGFESQPWHLCPWARHLIIIASLHQGVKWVPVRAELVD